MFGTIVFFLYSDHKWLFAIAIIGWAFGWALVFTKLKHKIGFFVGLILIASSLWGLINFTPFQNFLTKKVTETLSQNLHTTVSVKHVNFSLFNKMLIEGVYVQDKNKDTLLYAGTARVNISDWFFFKDTATLKYIGLKDAIINLNRTDSVWNYQFLIDYFSSPKNPTASPKKQLEIDFKIMELENVRFNKKDKWVGQDLTVDVTKLSIDADMVNFSKKKISLNSINLNHPVFYQSNYAGKRPPLNVVANTTDTITAPPTAFKWNNDGWIITINDLSLENGSFQNEKQTDRLPYTDRFDGQHLLFAAINGNLKYVHFEKDTLWADVNLATKEKSGFEIKKLQAKLKFTPEIMEFNNLDLVTNKSKLGNYYAMSYTDFNEDMSDFLHSVKLTGNFENSTIHSDDIAFFAPDLKTWNRTVIINGNAKGTIDNLVAKKMVLKSGNTSVDGDMALRGLPDIKNTFIDFKSNSLVTNYTDLVSIIPSLKNVTKPALNKLGNIGFKGNFTGFVNDFVTYGSISTNLGNLIADVNMKLPEGKPATYSGKISSSGFKLGQFINSSGLGNIALDGNVVGNGFTLKDLQANFKGDIHQLEFSGYNYKNITVDGKFEKELFTGHGKVNDPNLQIENFDGSIGFAEKDAAFNFDAVLKKSNFKQLGWANEDFALDGHFNLNFTGNNIDKFLGQARVYNATLLQNNTRLSFDSLTLNSYYKDDKKFLSIESNEIDGNITGNFKILELPDAFKVFLNRYYPAYIPKPKHANLSDQDFSFNIKTKEVDQYVQLIDPKLKGFNNATFSGNLNLAKNELNVKADVPQLEYDKKIFNSVSLESKGNLDALDTKITTGDIVINDSLHFPGTELSIKSSNDVSVVALKTSASKTLNSAELNATVKTLTDGVTIHFSPSSFIVNDKKWQLEKDGELTIRKSYIDASEVKFVQGDQEITLSTEMAQNGTDHTDVVARLKKVNINDFAPLFLKKPRLEGLLTGTVTLSDPFGKPSIEYSGVAEKFKLDDKEIGDTKLSGAYNSATGVVDINANADNKNYKFNIKGYINTKDSSDNQMNFDLAAEHFDISLLDNYLGSIFSNMKGDAVSTLKISGSGKHQSYSGIVTLADGSLKVNYTQCKYKFNNATLLFNPGEINLGTMQLKDTLGNSGTASGKIYYNNFFEDMSFENVKFETGKMLLLNTNEIDNDQFYGKVIGSATLTLNGPVTDMKMKIKGEPSILDTSHIFLPTGTGREASTLDYIDIIQFGTKMEDAKSSQGSNISVDMDFTATPSCKIDVILDEATGDVIKGSGNGHLNIKVGTTEPISIRGRYDITSGEYKFNFQTIFQKYFTVQNGSSLVWNGDPYLAVININAEYLAPNVDLSSLTTSTGAKYSQKSNINIVAHLTNTLKAPQIKFEFVIPKESQTDRSNDPILLENLKKFSKDENEMNRQVASLLLFNSFITDNGGFGGSVNQFLSGTVGQVISGFLSNQLTRFFQRVFKDPTLTPYLSFNSNYNLTSKELINALQASGNFGFKKEYFNGRLIVSLGGNIDYNNPYILQARNTNVLLTPDITVEYILSKDGKLRVVGFNRTSVDVTLGQRNRTGARLSYQKEFDKKRRQPKRKETPAAIKTKP